MGTTILTPTNLKNVKFEVSGMDEYLKKIENAGRNIDEVIAEAIEESAKPIVDDIKAWANKHKLTGATLEGVTVTDIQRDGNRIFVDIGIDTGSSKNAWHAVFVEYGTPTQAADPGIRNAFSENKSKVKRIQKNILNKGGIPIA